MSDQPLSCQLHDYLEIACLYRMQVWITLQDGHRLRGIAITTRTSSDKKEYLLIEVDGVSQEIELSRLKQMQAVTRNPHFDSVDF